ncbi:MAG: sulfotransferase [Sneathiella sp.]
MLCTASTIKDPIDEIEKILIFICPGRSGSTLISEVIMEHEFLGWPVHYLEYAPNLPQLDLLRHQFENKYWRVKGEKALFNKTRFLNAAVPRPTEAYGFWNSVTRKSINFSRDFLLGETATYSEKKRIRLAIFKMAKRQGRRSFSFKLTGPGRIQYLQSIYPHVKFINVYRDPIATVKSLLKIPFWKDLGMSRLWWTGAYTPVELIDYENLRPDPVTSTAFQVNKILRSIQHEAQSVDADILNISYEKLIRNPEDQCEKILDFAELPSSENTSNKLKRTQFYSPPNVNTFTSQQLKKIDGIFSDFVVSQ